MIWHKTNDYKLLREKFLASMIDENGDFNFRLWKKSNDLYKEVQSINMGCFTDINEKIWAFKSGSTERGACAVCEKPTNFKHRNIGFYRTCSLKCAAIDPWRNAKIKATELERYPEGHHTRTADYRKTVLDKYDGVWPGTFGTDSHKEAIQKKYGVSNVFQSKEIKEKIKQTNLTNHGVENPQQVKSIRARARKTKIEKYGQDGWNPEQVKKTLLERYGVDNPLKSPEIRDKIEATCMEKYGVRHHMQDPETFERVMKAQQQAAYKYKDYVSPSGKSYKVQGYEGPVINYLLQAGVQENDLTNIRFEVPIVPYSFDKKERIYFPDIYIKSKRMLVEVKSTYTYKNDLEKNLAKQKAAKKLGYHHIIVVWDAVNDSIVQII